MATLTRPILKKGETLQSASFQKRMRAFNRQEALAEATREQKLLQAEDAARAKKRDVLAEVADKPGRRSTKPAAQTATKKTTKVVTGIASSGRSALLNRAQALEEAIEGGIEEAIEGGIEEANDEDKRKRKRK